MTLTPAVSIFVLPVVLVVLAAVGALLVSGAKRRSAQQVVAAATAGRPGWSGVAAPDGLGRRYRVRPPFNGLYPAFRDFLYGPLGGGLHAETFHFSTSSHQPTGMVTFTWTVATVVLPGPLPSVSVASVRSAGGAVEAPVPAAPGEGCAQTYHEGGSGPLWAGLRGHAVDPEAAAALFTPDVLGRTRALGMDWRTDGCVIIGVAPGNRPPQAMFALVDALAQFAALLPEQVLRAAAEQPDPWRGPTAERPA